MDTWQVGSALGVNNATVSRDMKESARNLADEPRRDMKSSDRNRSDEPRRERLAQVH